uniref:NIDO domain-containing protein n=1 Tax=Acrobeloides nanus TaxID=290746 RepID=A0A914C542_9BILA
MIAPFWADISTNVTPDSHVYWRKNTSEADLNRTTEEITQAFPNVKSIDLKWVLVATWVNVTRYCQQQVNCDTRTNTFQAVVSTDGVRSYVLFLYDELSWDLGDGTFGAGFYSVSS